MITRYDIWVLVYALSLSVSVVIALVIISMTTSFVLGNWWLVPFGWFIGSIMTRGYDKYHELRYQKKKYQFETI